jgi:hypothetical protein
LHNTERVISNAETVKSKSRGKKPLPRVEHDLAAIIEHHLQALGWNQAQLAANARISKAQLSGWLGSQTRSISRNHVNRIACAIATGYGWGALPGIDNLDGILNELMRAAGYSAALGSAQDLVWRRLSGGENPRLRVGWVEYPPFAFEAPGPALVSGIAVDITTRVGELTGCRIEWERFQWSEIIDALYKRAIDMVCPILMLLPTRLLRVRFSDPIEGIFLPINGLVHRDFRNAVVLANPEELRSDSILLNSVAGEVGQTLCGIFAPKAQAEQPHGSFEEACTYLRTNPTHRELVRCLIADETICRHWQERFPDELDLLFKSESTTKVSLPVAFGVHPDEKLLLEMINTCITIMTQTQYIRGVLSRPEYRWLSGNALRSPNAPAGHFRRLGTLHLHIDGAEADDLPVSLIREFEAGGRSAKITTVARSIAGPQRQELSETYSSHNPQRGAQEAMSFFSTVETRNREDLVYAAGKALSQLRSRKGVVVEAERVVARVDSNGRWTSVAFDEIAAIASPEVDFASAPTMPFEIHHAFDIRRRGDAPFNLEKLLADTNRLGIPVGGWFMFSKRDCWSYRSNSFANQDGIQEKVTREWQLLDEYLRSSGLAYELWTIVERVLGVWRL